MNNIFSKKDLVKTSSKPWKTRLANMFLVENKYYLVDLPWYWFAKLGKNLKTELDGLISWYLEEKKPYIKKVVLLIDSKLWAQEIDIEMYKFLLELGLEVVIVLSKIDKLSKSELIKSITHTKKSFFWQEIIPVSNKNKIWLKALIKVLKHTLLN
jgi:GTP-binding protein